MSQLADAPITRAPSAERARRRELPLLPLLVAGCFVLAALSLILPSPPGKDPWSWIIWGREVALETVIGGKRTLLVFNDQGMSTKSLKS